MKRIIIYAVILLLVAGVAITVGMGLDMGTDLDIDSNPASISSPPPPAFILESGGHLILESSTDHLLLES